MLTKKQNFLETIKGGNPDRFVNQFEFMNMIGEAPSTRVRIGPGQEGKTDWGVLYRWPEGQVASFPVHDEENIVVKDITRWRDYVKAPPVEFPEEAWAPAIAHANSIDRNEEYVTVMHAPGVFEMTHHLLRMENALMNYYEEPESMHELIDYIADYELRRAKELIDHLHPDALFHHDDWGSQINSFLSPEMFENFIMPAYKKIYGFYKANGVELIVHHSDSYAANLVPHMIEMGVDVFQGAVTTNNIPKLIKNYGGKITIMGGLNSGEIDFPGWTPEIVTKKVENACRNYGKEYFIPCLTMGGPGSLFPGVYDAVNQEIDRMSKEMF